jgi:hypothetical protein
MFILCILISCSMQPQNRSIASGTVQVAAVPFSAALSYDEVKEGSFVGGSLIYSPTNTTVNQLVPGMIIRLYLDHETDPNTTGSNAAYISGYLKIDSIDRGQVTVDYALYNQGSNLFRHAENVVIKTNESIDIDNDQVNDLSYVSAVENDTNTRQGFEDANYLQFLSYSNISKRTLFGLNDSDYPGGRNQTGILVVNPCGAITWDELTLAPSQDTGDSMSITRAVLPDIQVFDRVMDYSTKTVRSVNGIKYSGANTLIVHFDTPNNYTPFELSVTKFSGRIADLQKRYPTKSSLTSRSPSWVIYNLVDRTDGLTLFQGGGFLLSITNHFDLDLGLMGAFNVGFIWVDAWAGAELIANDTIMFYGQFAQSGVKDNKTLICDPSADFMIGPIPCSVSLPIYLGTYSSSSATAYASWGYQLNGQIGAWVHGWASVKIRWKWCFPYPSLSGGIDSGTIQNFSATEVPLTAVFKGNIVIRPYLEIDPTLSICLGLLSFDTPAQFYLEGDITGDAIYSNGVATAYSSTNARGFININFYDGINISAGLDLSFCGYNKYWNLGTLYSTRDQLPYSFNWMEPANPTNIIAPSNFTFDGPTPADGSIILEWQPVQTATGYWLYRSTNNGASFDTSYYLTTTVFKDLTGLNTGVNYTYAVSAINAIKQSVLSPTLTASPTAPPTPYGNVSVTPNADGSLHLTWDPSVPAGTVKLLLLRGTNANNPVWTNSIGIYQNGGSSFATLQTYYDDYQTFYGVTNYYSIACKNYAGVSAKSSETYNTPVKPGQVTGPSFQNVTLQSVTLQWNPVSGALGYWIYRSTNLGGTPVAIGYTNGTTLMDSIYNVQNPLQAGLTYYYQIIATNMVGGGAASTVISNQMAVSGTPVVPITTNQMRIVGTNLLSGYSYLFPNTNVSPGAVYASADGVNYTLASGTQPWSVALPLNPGTNVIWVYAVDAFGMSGTTNVFTNVYIPGLILWSTLNSLESITNPLVGPAGICSNYNPIYNQGSGFGGGVPGTAHYYSYEDQTCVSPFCYFPNTVVPANSGCIEFWAALNFNYGANIATGGAPTFFSIQDGASCWGLNFNQNDGGGGGGLCAFAGGMTNSPGHFGHTATYPYTTTATYASVINDANGQNATWASYIFHHYALIWDMNGVPGTANSRLQVYVDGVPAVSGYYQQPDVLNAPTNGNFYIFPNYIGGSLECVYMVNLKIWNYSKTNFADRFATND